MRRLALALLAASLPLGGCLDALLSVECEDECVQGERICEGDEILVCKVNLLLSTCTFWESVEDCGEHRLFCINAVCACPTGLAYCGTCVDLARDPANCGGCGVTCASGVCVNGVCSP